MWQNIVLGYEVGGKQRQMEMFHLMPYYHCSVGFEIFIAVMMKAQVLQFAQHLLP
jgi:hypothetical protein